MNSQQIKGLACLLMLADHVAIAFWTQTTPAYLALRLAGRLAFPLFAWQLGVSWANTRSKPRFARSLLAFGVLSQIPYGLLLGFDTLNIFFTLLAALPLFWVYDHRERFGRWTWGIMAGYAALILVLNWFSFGAYGVLLALLLYVRREQIAQTVRPMMALSVLGTFGNPLQFASVFALPILMAYNHQRGLARYKWGFYAFYPLHLLVLWGLRLWWVG